MTVLTESGAMSLRICAIKRFAPNEVHITRIYGYSVLILMLDGVLRFCENGTLVELKKGEYYIQRANCFQNGFLGKEPLLPPQGELPVYWYLEFEGGNYSDSDAENGIPLRGTWDADGMQSTLRVCEQACNRQTDVNRFLLNSHMYRIFGMLYTDDSENRRKTQLLSVVRDYIGAHYMDISTLDDVAKHFGYTRDYLSKLFLQRFRMTLRRYLQTVRMEQALWLLQNSDTPVTQIPRIVGYANYTSFYRSFLDFYGVSPSDAARSHPQNGGQS